MLDLEEIYKKLHKRNNLSLDDNINNHDQILSWLEKNKKEIIMHIIKEFENIYLSECNEKLMTNLEKLISKNDDLQEMIACKISNYLLTSENMKKIIDKSLENIFVNGIKKI